MLKNYNNLHRVRQENLHLNAGLSILDKPFDLAIINISATDDDKP